MIETRRAGPDDIKAFYAETKPDQQVFPSLIAWVALEDDRPVALYGFARVDARWLAFCDLTEKARPFKKRIVREGRAVMAEIQRLGVPYVYATIDEDEPSAERFQRALGFRPDHRADGLMRWKKNGDN